MTSDRAGYQKNSGAESGSTLVEAAGAIGRHDRLKESQQDIDAELTLAIELADYQDSPICDGISEPTDYDSV